MGELAKVTAERDAVLRENEALREALQFYADEGSWDARGVPRAAYITPFGTSANSPDRGQIARDALTAAARERVLTEIAQDAQDAGAYDLPEEEATDGRA